MRLPAASLYPSPLLLPRACLLLRALRPELFPRLFLSLGLLRLTLVLLSLWLLLGSPGMLLSWRSASVLSGLRPVGSTSVSPLPVVLPVLLIAIMTIVLGIGGYHRPKKEKDGDGIDYSDIFHL